MTDQPSTVSSTPDHPTPAPRRLRVEHGPRLLGIATTTPRLSWWQPPTSSPIDRSRVEARVDGGPPVTVDLDSSGSILVPWPFDALAPRSRVTWRVQVHADDGWSAWSDPADFEVGLVDRAQWDAVFVGHPDDHGDAFGGRGARGAFHLRRRFTVTEPLDRARLRATALGIYELHLDGRRVGDLELTPGFTAYRSVLEAQTYDVTTWLGPGEHELVATLSDGWYRGSVGFTREQQSFGDQLALLAQIELDGPGGTEVIGTDDRWEVSADGPIVAADLIEGERVDLRRPFPPVDGWVPVAIVEVDAAIEVSASPAPPTRQIDHDPVAGIDQLPDGGQIVRLPRNINGWLRIDADALGPAGTTTRLVHGEALLPSGDLDVRNLEVTHFVTQEPLGHGQLDEVVSAGPDGPPFEPRHTSHGFQYVRVDGSPPLDPDDVTGVMVHTDLVRTGRFTCSDDRLDRLHEAAVLSFRDNACEIPTDCPQRERAGWTGDWQIFAPTAAFLYDVAGFSDRWLRDLAHGQWPDGRVTNHVPDPIGPAGMEEGIARFMTGSSGWGDAAILVPWAMYETYGDLDLLVRQFPSMEAWVSFALDAAATGRHPSRETARPVALPHEEYLWDAGFHWGEWTEPGADMMGVLTGEIEQGHVATAYLSRSLSILADIAERIGRVEVVDRYRTLAAATRDAWRAEYVVDGRVTPSTQANLTRALAFGLVDDGAERAVTLADLVTRIEEADHHVGTGFLTTPFLLPTLADQGRPDLAYALLMQTTAPSWLAMVEAGATTIWENWDGLGDDGGGSLNHYSKGAVVTFLHRYVAGIRPIADEPAYRRFEIRPVPGGGLTAAEATFDSPYGTIRSSWTIDGDRFDLSVTVPPGTRALLTLPDGTTDEVGPGDHERSIPLASTPS